MRGSNARTTLESSPQAIADQVEDGGIMSAAAPSLTASAILTSQVVDCLAGAIGHTPLIRMRRASAATGCEILGKAEFMQPGGSVKDRAALGIIEDAERRGQLVPGEPGIVVEGTAGNTGIGLTLVANARGYKSIIVVPHTQSREKLD